METILEVLLLLALPASGKSELRRYLDHLDPERRRELHLGEPAHLDDYPYVHLMRWISEELQAIGESPPFFAGRDGSMLEPRDWGTLIHLLNEDFARLWGLRTPTPVVRLLERFDRARRLVGAPAPFANLAPAARRHLEDAIADEAAEVTAGLPEAIAGGTVVIEFARGGPEGAELPLPAPLGYRHSLSLLAPEILDGAAVLYVWVTPEQSRRRNRERSRRGTGRHASILHHGVPEQVMRDDYGTDDLAWLLETSDRPGTIRVEHQNGAIFHLPAVRFDNRSDLTSFLRDQPSRWPDELLRPLHRRLARAMHTLAGRSRMSEGG